MNNVSHHLTQHLYRYNIFTYHKSDYSEDSHVDRTLPDYAMPARKYETSLHFNPESLDNYLKISFSKNNDYEGSICFRNLVAVKPPLARTIALQVGFLCKPSIMAM